MYFAIRDDDTSFFTEPEELEFIYKDIINYIPISFSVVPFSVQAHCDEVRFSDNYNDNDELSIGENEEIVDYLSQNIQKNKAEIMLHGYSHQYKKINNKWTPECIWKSYKRLSGEIKEGKNYLEELFGEKIETFVAPSNEINMKGIRVVEDLKMNLSGTVGRDLARILDIKYISNYFKKGSYNRIKHHTYPYILDYSKHKELTAYRLDAGVTYDQLEGILLYCKKVNANFVLYTHYKRINMFPELLDTLNRIVDKALKIGFKGNTIKNIFKNENV